MRRFKFNMVEIALAVAVISIGLSAVLVLFPVGINATRAAMDENRSSDAVEYVTRYIRGQFLAGWRTNSAQSSFSGFLDTEYKTSESEPSDGLKWAASPVANFPELYRASNCGSGVYKFTSTGDDTFSAVVKVWMPANDLTADYDKDNQKSACPIYIPNTAPGKNNAPQRVAGDGIVLPDGENFGSIVQSVLVEISWPGDLPAADRVNKRVFRVDVYNPYYGIAP
ncbi:MAG: hypothetical protein IJS01_05135 [Lentisphaeria bacterium]|nr:hypothetical protein [Lentisphaeria bacterium]